MADPAIGLAVAGSALGNIGNAWSTWGTAQDLKLTEEQLRKLKELERLEALDAFGFDKGERDLYRQQLLTPVQQAENEALARFGAVQNIEDIGQGSAFRQQQALKQTSEAARAETAQAVAKRDAEIARQQQEAMMRMRQQELRRKQLERQAFAQLLGGGGEAMQVGALAMEGKLETDALLKDLEGSSQAVVSGAANLLGIDTRPGSVVSGSQVGKGIFKATDQSLGQSGVDAVERGVGTLSYQELLKRFLMGANPSTFSTENY